MRLIDRHRRGIGATTREVIGDRGQVTVTEVARGRGDTQCPVDQVGADQRGQLDGFAIFARPRCNPWPLASTSHACAPSPIGRKSRSAAVVGLGRSGRGPLPWAVLIEEVDPGSVEVEVGVLRVERLV